MSDGGLFDLLDPLDRIIRREGGEPAPEAGAAPAAIPPTEIRPASGPLAPSRATLRARWAAFYEISQLLTSSRIDFDDVLRAILDLVIRHTGAERGLLLLSGEEGKLEVEIARNDREEPLDPKEIAYSVSIVRRALAEKKPFASSGKGLAGLSDSVIDLKLRSAMCVPLKITPASALIGARPAERRRLAYSNEPDVLGAIYVDSALAAAGFHPDDLEFFVALANQATSTILNARLYQQATTEPLSRLYTRWHFQRMLSEAARRAETRKVPYSLLLGDLDGFKAVNDTHGHLAGDQVIREIGDVLRGTTRAIDACFRYGGEEFAVILGDTDEGGAAFAAEKVRAAVAARRYAEPHLAVTMSIGCATAPPAGHDSSEIVKRADQALYHAKLRGKNRVERWTETLGGAAKRRDKLAGIVTGDFAADYNNVALLIDAVASISSTVEVGDLLTLAVDKVVEATGAERGALMLADEGAPAGAPRLTTVVARDRKKQGLRLVEKFSRTIPERVLASGESVCVMDAAEEGAAGGGAAGPQSVQDLALRTIMCVPLLTKDRTIGVIYVDSRTRSGDLKESNLPFFEGLARQVATAIENARLKARLAYEEGGTVGS